jgi:hypothetical protein
VVTPVTPPSWLNASRALSAALRSTSYKCLNSASRVSRLGELEQTAFGLAQ